VLARLSRADRWLLGVYLPLYLAVFALHVHESARSGLAQLPVFAQGVAGDYPVVAGYRLETDSSGSGLRRGDRLIRIGERDLRGAGYVGFQALGLARTTPGRPVPLVFEREGVRSVVALEARPHAQPWSRVPLLVLTPLLCTLVLLRAPGSPGAQRFFAGFLTYAFRQAEFYGGPEWKTRLAAVVLAVSGPLAILTMMHWARRFPDEMPERARVWRGWPWLAALLYAVVVRVSYPLGAPVPAAWIAQVSFASHALAIAAGLGILGWNYGHAYASGRRRLRWILLGTLFGSLPLVAALLAPLVAPAWAGFGRALSLGFLATVVWFTGLGLAVVRDNAFDVDRLIGATAAWSLAAGAAVAALAVVVPAAATAVAGSLDVEPLHVRIAFAVALGALVVPLGARLRPRIDQLLFPGREALREGTESLLEDLAHCRSTNALLALAAARSARLLGAEGHALYRREEGEWRLGAGDGLAPPPWLPEAAWAPGRLAPGPAPAALAAAGFALVVPVRRERHADAILCLSRKRSGDIYTRTDTDALVSVAARIEATRARLAKERADRESRAKTDLIAAASHDLRQPLHAVGLLAEALAARLSDPEARELVERIGASTQELDDMLTSLLDRSKLDAGAVRAERERVEVQELFAHLERDFAGPAAAKGLRLRVAHTRLAVESDRLLLLRILRNLVSNAIRYTPNGGVLVGARPRGADVAIEVRDGGPGIPEHARATIFAPFQQLPGASRAGLGLGLSIVDGLARVLGHAVELRSAPGRGSTFAVHVPRAAPAASHAPPPAPFAAPALEPRRVLVVDDDDAVRGATATLLRAWGCEVREASDAETALRAAAEWQPELALLDHHLGAGGSGSELAERLRGAHGERLRLVLVTAEADPARVEALRRAGFAVLRKPLLPARLRALLAAGGPARRPEDGA
jgi:signal transduction histidine kinase/CheY-like chemotaxis protein